MQTVPNLKSNHFPIIILIGRPGSGKSEIIDFLVHIDTEQRLRRYRIAKLDVLDDFPMLWTWFEEDDILENEFNKPRLYTDSQGYFKEYYLWDLLIRRLDLEYQKRMKDNHRNSAKTTTIIEFSRGAEHGGYRKALNNFSEEILKNSCILYVNVSYRESQRKNRLRFNSQRPHSILEHSLPDEKLEKLYSEDDWHEITRSDSNFLVLDSCRIPFVVFENEDDVTSGKVDALGERLELTLDRLWDVYQKSLDSLSGKQPGGEA